MTKLIVIGKTTASHLQQGELEYIKRLSRFDKIELVCVSDVKKKHPTEEALKKAEADQILKHIKSSDFVIGLDEHGTQYSSREFAKQIQKWSVNGMKMVFVIGGAYGFGDALYTRFNAKMSLSSMTFSHQMVRMIFLEQLYRAHTILRKLPYHHD